MLPIAAQVVLAMAVLASLSSYLMGGKLAKIGSPRFEMEDIPDLTGKVAIVTGANSGIGKITARELAMHGAHVIATSRDPASGARALQEINAAINSDTKFKHGTVEFITMDLSKMISIYKFAREISFKNKPVDILVLNAGIMFAPFNLTEDGYESQFGVNYLGHFMLTKLIMPWLTRSKAGRIVHVSSLAHYFTYRGGINFLSMYDEAAYNRILAYGQSKLANILFSNALARRLQDTSVTSNALHPGTIRTNLTRHVVGSEASTLMKIQDFVADKVLGFMDPEMGALTTLYVATSPELDWVSGRYYTPIGKEASPSSYATDETLQEELWAVGDAAVSDFFKGRGLDVNKMATLGV